MSYIGDFALASDIDFKFTTRRFSTGAPFTLAGTPSVAAYPNNSTTEISAGITLTVDFDARTGLNHVRITATGANGYAAGSSYDVVITAGTVDSVSVVGEVVGKFSIEARSALRPTTAGRTLDVSAGGEAGLDWANIGSPTTTQNLSGTSTKALEPTVAGRTLDVTATGAGGVDWANVESQSTAVNLSGTNIDVDQVVASVSGNVGGNVSGSVGSVGTGGISSTSFAAGAIDAAAIAADAIGASELAASAVDEIWDEPMAELAQAAPSATPAMRALLAMLYMIGRNKIEVTATEKRYTNDAGTTVFKKTLTDDGTTYTEAEMVSGP